LRFFFLRVKSLTSIKDEEFSDLSDFSWEEESPEEYTSEETSSDDEGEEVEVVFQPRMRTRSSRGKRQ
jgi:hypothetical protein